MKSSKTDDTHEAATTSAFRLRLGMLFIVLWWVPIWLISPAIADLLGYGNDPSAKHTVFVVLIVLQTLSGLLGILIASKAVIAEVKHTPRRKVPGTMWRVLWTGKSSISAEKSQ